MPHHGKRDPSQQWYDQCLSPAPEISKERLYRLLHFSYIYELLLLYYFHYIYELLFFIIKYKILKTQSVPYFLDQLPVL